MQNANGSQHPNGQHAPTMPPNDTASYHDASFSPSKQQKRFFNGRIVTRVFANPTAWGDIDWKVEQFRVKTNGTEEHRYPGFYFEDMQDAMRGIYGAKRWIQKVERRRRGRWLWWW